MKKIIAVILLIALCLSLIACGGSDIEGRIIPTLHGEITWRVRSDAGVNPDNITFQVEETSENEYKVTGNFTISSKQATYSVKVKHDTETDKLSISGFDWKYQ